MIKFFRKIRQNLLTEGKTGKYFKYAIGEILLVVIGILIAVQVNDLNNDQKDKKMEQRYISDLMQDLKADSIAIAQFIKNSDEQVRTKNNIVSYYNGQSYPKDSLVYYFEQQWKPIYNFTPILTTLEEMKSTGRISVISNLDLRRLILDTYNKYEVHIKNNEGIYKMLQDEFWKVILSKLPNLYPDVQREPSNELDIESALKNFEIKNRLMVNYVMGMNKAIKNLQNINNQLLEELRNNLK